MCLYGGEIFDKDKRIKIKDKKEKLGKLNA